MWAQLNHWLFVCEILMVLLILGYAIRKRRFVMPLTFGCIIGVLAFVIYLIPSCYRVVIGEDKS